VTAEDLTGRRFGYLVVVRRVPNHGTSAAFLCRCDCGNEREHRAVTLRANRANSCGCSITRRRRAPRVCEDGTIEIVLTKGQVAVIDACDADLAEFNWSSSGKPGMRYAYRRSGDRLHALHRVIAERAGMQIDGLEVDHEDGNKLNCRRGNLRPATRAQNCCNKGASSRSTSGVKGVSWSSKSRKWGAWIGAGGKSYCLGLFETKEEAAEAYRKAANELHGEFARTA
jgi:hypothetical protein